MEPEELNEATEEVVTEEEAKEETVITFGDDTPEEETQSKRSEKFAKMRIKNREQAARIKELEEAGKSDELTALGAEPQPEDFDYDSARHIAAIREWDKAKAKHEAVATAAKDDQERQATAYQDRLSEYRTSRADFDASEFDEAEGVVKSALSDARQSMLIHALKGNAAALIRGLGQNEATLEKLAATKDDVDFIVAVTRLESSMKVSQKTPKTAPERRVEGTNASAAMSAKDRAIEKAREDGDIKEVMRLRRTG